ncbi:CHAT domain-containing protein [Streptomyces sp. NPDC021019]|uniref:CHAT domain-containing protein n=1 Tax=Streptomyces sp. NPDC021019 TaxID=3365108 RepID=UPI0037A223D6
MGQGVVTCRSPRPSRSSPCSPFWCCPGSPTGSSGIAAAGGCPVGCPVKAIRASGGAAGDRRFARAVRPVCPVRRSGGAGPGQAGPVHRRRLGRIPGAAAADRCAGSRDDRNRLRLLVAAMQHTPDAPDLPGPQAEADHVTALVPGASVRVGADATRDAVLDAVPSSGRAHVACHGYSAPDNPSDSHLVPHDHDRARLSDEAIPSLTAFQISGFSQVADTLRRVDDAVAPAFSRQIYGAPSLDGAVLPVPAQRGRSASPRGTSRPSRAHRLTGTVIPADARPMER